MFQNQINEWYSIYVRSMGPSTYYSKLKQVTVVKGIKLLARGKRDTLYQSCIIWVALFTGIFYKYTIHTKTQIAC